MGKLEELIAKNVLNRRKAMGLSQNSLAQRARVSYHTIWRAENGKNLRKANLEQIADALNCSIDDLAIESSTGSGRDPLIMKLLQMIQFASDGDLKDLIDLLSSRAEARSAKHRKA